MWMPNMPFAFRRLIPRLNDWFASDYCTRFERYLRWLRSRVAIIIQAMIASTLCGMFLHPQGFLLACGLGAVLAVGVAWPWFSLLGVTGSLSFAKARSREGEPVKAVVAIRNRCPWGAWGLAIHAGFDERSAAEFPARPDAGLSLAAGWRTTECLWDFVPGCRGEYPAHPPDITTGFPFGLWLARRPLTIRRTLLVWPRTFPVGTIPDAAEGRSAFGLAPRDKPGTWGDVLGVRPYRRGDLLRRIHWPQTARHGQLVVCEVQASAVPRIQIVLDTYPGSHLGVGPDSSREWAIRIAASFAEGWINQGAEVEMILDQCCVMGRGGSARARSARALDALARLAPGGAHQVTDLLGRSECRRFNGGLQVVVTTDLALRGLSAADARQTGSCFVVLEAGAFGLGARSNSAYELPVVPWLWIDGLVRVATHLRRTGREVAVAR
jgi:uncharacterized protein (DUF58 family)